MVATQEAARLKEASAMKAFYMRDLALRKSYVNAFFNHFSGRRDEIKLGNAQR